MLLLQPIPSVFFSSKFFFSWDSQPSTISSSSSSLVASRTSRRRLYVAAATRSEDDYHATLEALKSKGHTPRKSLGQHYMLNSAINDQLVEAADVKDGDVVLEIGPGTGSLTNVLVNSGATVLSIEKDPHMVTHLRERFASIDRFTVLQEDFTKCQFLSQLISLLESGKPVEGNLKHAKVVANIPFNISTDVVKELLPMGDILSEVVLLLQVSIISQHRLYNLMSEFKSSTLLSSILSNKDERKNAYITDDETALRLVEAPVRSSEYRPINIFVNFYSDPEYKLKVLRTNFFPQPNVDAAVVRFKLKQTMDYPPVASTKSFFTLVNSAFAGKRKMLRKSLQYICTSLEIEDALRSLGLPHTSRPQELTLDNFVSLHNLIMID